MSTRSTTHFVNPGEEKPEAIIYRHSDGYPKGAGADLLEFVAKVKELKDKRFDDPSYLAAKYVVYLAEKFAVDYDWGTNPTTEKPRTNRLDFLSVGVCASDPSDIAYRYVVICDGGPTVECYKVNCSYPEGVWTSEKLNLKKELAKKD